MGHIRVLSVFGTRPEAIKMAPLVNALKQSNHVESLVCVTAQHREMLDQVLTIFDIYPDYDLDIMKEHQSLTGITNKVLDGLESVIADACPDIVLVHGIPRLRLQLPLLLHNRTTIGHVEAGLRTYNKNEPFQKNESRPYNITRSSPRSYHRARENY